MLVLTRKIGEIIRIGDGSIGVQVLDVRGNSVRFGIAAPRGVIVHRQEVWERINKEDALAQRLRNEGDGSPSLSPGEQEQDGHIQGAEAVAHGDRRDEVEAAQTEDRRPS